jgi:FlgD Ig-like domain
MRARPSSRIRIARPMLQRRSQRPMWRRLFPFLVALGLLVVAPVLSHAQGAGADSVRLTWTAVGDDSLTGTATVYDLRMSTSPISEAQWSAATSVAGVPTPLASGTLQTALVNGLTRGTTYYFAIKTGDDAGNWSGISNVVQWDWVLDTAPPAAPSGLAGARAGGGIQLTWAANAEADLQGYTVFRATNASGPFTALTGSLLASPDFVDATPPAGASNVWYAVSASDVNGNESARSASVSVAFSTSSSTGAIAIRTPYPNPSSIANSVRIPVDVPPGGAAGALLDITDAGNRRVRRIDLGHLVPGPQDVTWDGRNDAGREVAPGAYRAWLIAGEQRQSVRLLRVP